MIVARTSGTLKTYLKVSMYRDVNEFKSNLRRVRFREKGNREMYENMFQVNKQFVEKLVNEDKNFNFEFSDEIRCVFLPFSKFEQIDGIQRNKMCLQHESGFLREEVH